MKKLLCYIIIIFSTLAITSEVILNFPKLRLLHYSFNTEKYFEEDHLIILNENKSSTSKGVGGMIIYDGILKKNKIKNKISVYPESMEDKILSDGRNIYCKVWYCKNLNYVILKEENNLYPYRFWNVWIGFIFYILAIPCVIFLIKNRRSENLFISDVKNIINNIKK
ncbi:hypothetical protein OIU80_06055 [Flavobacterium sp. LS1R47]|uniref:Uncharacterized protein n=1 Tax=Flavobacterium frigoritolerans TaxID=2987686 RepID=A0A9X3C7N2_9FLAO|nr:hypothetical protein [Flavobacterium frigoritolerans]MCV9931842.1 hypothetical protein [Flavobacterium frigoritolerans]